MKRKLLIGLLVLALLSVPFFAVACEEDTTVYTLTINDHNTAGTGPALAADYWAEYVEEQSEGRLDIEVIHGAALFTGDEIYGQLAQDGCDGGQYVVKEEDGFLLNLVVTLPFLGFPEQHFEDMFYTLWDEFPEFAEEWDDVTVLGMMIMPGTQIHTVDLEIASPDDIEGVKLFCAETSLVNIINAVGGVGVEQPITDMAPSVQTGLVEGVFNHFPVCNAFSALELMHCHTTFGGGINFSPMLLLMSNTTMDELPNSLRDILIDSGDYWFEQFCMLDDADMEMALDLCEANNDTFIELTSSEIAEWREIIKVDVIDTWIADCEAAGLPGQEVYDRLMELIAEAQ